MQTYCSAGYGDFRYFFDSINMNNFLIEILYLKLVICKNTS